MGSGLDLSAPTSTRRGFFPRATNQASRRSELLRSVVRLLDGVLRRTLRIYEFSLDAACLLRIALTRPVCRMTLRKTGVAGASGALVDLHFWNDDFEQLLAGKPTRARAALIKQHLQISLRSLAEYLEARPEINAPVIHARVVMPIGSRFAKLKAVAEMYGFSVTTSSPRGLSAIHDFFENFLVRALMWTFNPSTSHRRNLRLQRADLWIARETLLDRYLAGCSKEPHRDEARVPEFAGRERVPGAGAGTALDVRWCYALRHMRSTNRLVSSSVGAFLDRAVSGLQLHRQHIEK